MVAAAFSTQATESVAVVNDLEYTVNGDVFAFPGVDQVTVAPPVCFCYVWKWGTVSKMYEMHCFDSYGGALPIIYATASTYGSIPYTCPPGQPWPTW